MSKGLEALEKVEDFEIQFGGYDETGEYKNYISLYQTPEYQVIKKELTALEIIRKRYYGFIWKDNPTKEEQELLKEVLL